MSIYRELCWEKNCTSQSSCLHWELSTRPPLSSIRRAYLHPSTLNRFLRRNRRNLWCLLPSTTLPPVSPRQERQTEERRRNTHRHRHTNDVVRQTWGLWTHSRLCLQVHTRRLTHRGIRQALHHCQVTNLEGEAASCSCNKSQKALLCLSVCESFILMPARINSIRLYVVHFAFLRRKKDKWLLHFQRPHVVPLSFLMQV